jgi:LuxR family maltose regulon positive regulatory protein
MAASGCHFLGQVQRAEGRLDAALRTYQQALEITASPGQPALPAAGARHVGMAEVAYQQGDRDAALRRVTEGIPQCQQFNYTQPLAAGLATLAWIRQATADQADALAAIGEAGQLAPGPDVASLLNPVPAQRAWLLLAQGDIAAAAVWVRGRGLDPGNEPGYPKEPEYLVLARVLIAQDQPGQALHLLERLYARAVAQDRTGSLIEIQLLRALALAAQGDDIAAATALTEALRLACPQGYVRVFADEGPPMAALIGRLAAAQRTHQIAVTRAVPPGYLAGGRGAMRC